MFNKKIILSILVVGFVCTAVGSATWASFTDTKTGTGNQITAGTLSLNVNGANTIITPFNFPTIAPGFNQPETVTFANVGSIPGSLSLNVKNKVETPGLDGITDLGNNLKVTITSGAVTLLPTTSVNALTNPISLGNLAATGTNGDTKSIVITFSVDTAVGNNIQGDGCTFDMEYNLAQTV